MPNKTMTLEEWRAEAVQRFGEDVDDWAFICPVCRRVQCTREYRDAGAPPEAVAFSCIGRWMKAGPFAGDNSNGCNYAGGGLIRLNPVTVVSDEGAQMAFDFAPVRHVDGEVLQGWITARVLDFPVLRGMGVIILRVINENEVEARVSAEVMKKLNPLWGRPFFWGLAPVPQEVLDREPCSACGHSGVHEISCPKRGEVPA